ncbi:hypothetical protein [Flavobacterium hercynium]|uniref:Uncharacterized protein n=1 Tax=Flavobacterium hercynium TaxID=387094 RepID=A0A226GWC7_9FLAO|nr:hypothetical protein [Flavobacterium hercynium]OXA86004.1 hypothetical protein B0A66_18540 [Flavobacterium hercynium]SMP37267.1 hypothetical protein SAMN06265346_12916 [Flavobacterium hercynium]
MNKIIVSLLLSIFLVGCKTSKEPSNSETAFKQYLIDTNKMDKDAVINDSYYDKYFLQYLDYETKNHISSNPYLKVNNVYSYLKNNGNSYIFSIFADDGRFYTGTYTIDSEYLTATVNGTIKLKQLIKLKRHGLFEIENNILKTRRFIITPFKEWYESDTGYIKNDTLHFTAIYKSKKYEYKKKWLSKTHKTHFIHKYQPKLIATKIKDSRTGLDVFMVEGEFTSNE